MPVRASGDEQMVTLGKPEQTLTFGLRIAPVPHFQTIKTFVHEPADLTVAQQHTVAAGVGGATTLTPPASLTACTTCVVVGDGVGM